MNERACVGVLILCTGEDYGKWRGRIQIECCFNDERQKHLQSKTNLKCTTPYHNRDNTFAILELSKKMVKLDTPIYAGSNMLDLSNLICMISIIIY